MKKNNFFRNKFVLFAVLLFVLGVTLKIDAAKLFPTDDDYAVVVDKTPSPIGGMEGIVKKIVYPDMAVSTRTEGKVYLLIYTNELGGVDDVKVIKGIGAGCDEESVRVIKKTKFTPAEQKGVHVKAKFSMALTFKIPG